MENTITLRYPVLQAHLFLLALSSPSCLNMPSAETTVKESYSLHDATPNGPYFFTLKFTYVFLDINTIAISLLQNTFMYDISLSWFLSHLYGFFITFSSHFLAFNPLLTRFLFSVHSLFRGSHSFPWP